MHVCLLIAAAAPAANPQAVFCNHKRSVSDKWLGTCTNPHCGVHVPDFTIIMMELMLKMLKMMNFPGRTAARLREASVPLPASKILVVYKQSSFIN